MASGRIPGNPRPLVIRKEVIRISRNSLSLALRFGCPLQAVGLAHGRFPLVGLSQVAVPVLLAVDIERASQALDQDRFDAAAIQGHGQLALVHLVHPSEDDPIFLLPTPFVDG